VGKVRDQIRLIFNRNLRQAVDKTVEETVKGNYKPFIDAIVKSIKRGVSPVAGIGRFKRYSKSYREAIKNGWKPVDVKDQQTSPVNMTLSGDMLKSLDTKQRGKKLFVEFTDEKAFYHNEQGAGKSRVIRRLLPTEPGERWEARLERELARIIKAIVRKIKFR
jgi:hypothetical protein